MAVMWGDRAARPRPRPHGGRAPRPHRRAARRRATSVPGSRSPPTARACRASSARCCTAGSARSGGSRKPARARRTAAHATALFAEIERESRQTLEEMRESVGVLRADTPLAPTAPQPTLTHLEALLVRAKGADARLIVEGGPRVAAARRRAVGLPDRRAAARRARGRARTSRSACASRDDAARAGRRRPGRPPGPGGDRAGARARAAAARDVRGDRARRARGGRRVAARPGGGVMPPRRDLIVGAVAALLGAALAVAEGMDARGASPPWCSARRSASCGSARATAWAIAVVALVVTGVSRAWTRSASRSWPPATRSASHAGSRAGRAWPARSSLLGAALLTVATSHSAGVPYDPVHRRRLGGRRRPARARPDRGSLAERARELEEEREAYAALSVRYERARIAAELHDIVAHAISVMVVQAAAGQRLAPRSGADRGDVRRDRRRGAPGRGRHGPARRAARRGGRAGRRAGPGARGAARRPRGGQRASTSRSGSRASARAFPRPPSTPSAASSRRG